MKKNFWKEALGLLVGAMVSAAIWILLRPRKEFTVNVDEEIAELNTVKIHKLQNIPKIQSEEAFIPLVMPKTKKKEIKTKPKTAIKPKTVVKSTEKTNLNTADKKALVDLPLIGESKADAILAYRKENGNFATMEDLVKVSGISDKLLAKIKALITV